MQINQEKSFKVAVQFLIFSSLFTIGWYWKFHNLPLMQSDSNSYIAFAPCRTVGYPFFLWAMKNIFGTLNVIPIVQLILLTLTATWLAVEFYKLTKQQILTYLLLTGLMINPIYYHAFNVLTESLSITLMMSFMAIVLSVTQQLSLRKLVCLSFITGLSILIRPVHYAYLPVFLLICLGIYPLLRQKFIQWLAAASIPLLGLVLLGCWGQYEKNGMFRLESMGGFNMIGKVSLIADSKIDSQYPTFLKEVAAYAQSLSGYLDQAPNNQMRYLLNAPYYDYFRYRQLTKILQNQLVNDQMYTQVSTEIIAARPHAYLEDTWINFCALWQLYDLMTFNERKDFKIFLDNHQPMPYQNYHWHFNQINFSFKNHPVFVWGIRLTLGGIALSGLMMILGTMITFCRRYPVSPIIFTGAIAAALTQSHFILIALAQAGLPRYSFGLWPTLVMVGIITLELIRQKLMNYFNQ